jgi:crotonobetainyl-CoA:carnitine CoA-transferase CaiB-like acyl-CoA transferase
MHVTGEPDGPPTSVGLPICDLGTGMWAVQGILAALHERQRTGVGRLVECSLLETRDRLQLVDLGPAACRP